MSLKKANPTGHFLAPLTFFDAKGPRTGEYELGTDYLINNRDGESYLSYADAAIAIVDEIEKKQFAGGKRMPRKSKG